jgi:hypothetical protein
MLLIGFVANVGIVLIELTRYETANEAWEIFVWEGSSHLALGGIVPLLLWFDRYFPLRTDSWRRSFFAHALFTVPWSLAHVTIMYWIRVGSYSVVNDVYHWPDWWAQFGYEYLKDFRAYFLFLAVIYLYRFVLRRLQGEAGYLSEGKEGVSTTEITDRFLIKKLGREFLVRVDDIDWIEASGNYVNLHVGGRVYPLRETMTGISERLQAQGFQRVHRSAVVNLDRVTEIVPFDSGDGEARLTTDVTVPVSRRYKQELRSRAGARSHS